MSSEQKELLLAKLAEAKAKAQEKNDPDTEALIEEAMAMIPPDDDDGDDPQP